MAPYQTTFMFFFMTFYQTTFMFPFMTFYQTTFMFLFITFYQKIMQKGNAKVKNRKNFYI